MCAYSFNNIFSHNNEMSFLKNNIWAFLKFNYFKFYYKLEENVYMLFFNIYYLLIYLFLFIFYFYFYLKQISFFRIGLQSKDRKTNILSLQRKLRRNANQWTMRINECFTASLCLIYFYDEVIKVVSFIYKWNFS